MIDLVGFRFIQRDPASEHMLCVVMRAVQSGTRQMRPGQGSPLSFMLTEEALYVSRLSHVTLLSHVFLSNEECKKLNEQNPGWQMDPARKNRLIERFGSQILAAGRIGYSGEVACWESEGLSIKTPDDQRERVKKLVSDFVGWFLGPRGVNHDTSDAPRPASAST
jgi:hypothetical protein